VIYYRLIAKQKDVIIIKQLLAFLKQKRFLIIYAITFTILNSIYLFLEMKKLRYIQKHMLNGLIEPSQYEALSHITNKTIIIEFLIIATFIILVCYLLLIKKENTITRRTLFFHLLIIACFIIISYILTITFDLQSLGNLTQQLLIPFVLNIITLIYSYILLRGPSR